MKYASIDIETTGLDPETCDILQIGIVLDNLEHPKPIQELNTLSIVIVKENYKGQPYALSMHKELFEKIANFEKYINSSNIFCSEETAIPTIKQFLDINGYDSEKSINIAGKNFEAFDHKFINKLPHANKLKFRARQLDPAILYMSIEDERLPDMKTCLERAGLTNAVSHTAVEDALDIVRLIRYKFIK